MPVKASRAFASVKEPSAFADRWSTWGQAYGGAGTTNGEASVIGSHDTSSRIAGVAAGMDYRVTRETLVGFALSGGETSWGLAQGLGSGKGDVFQAGVYASHRSGPAFVSAALAYSWYDMTTDRTLTVSGTDVLRARFQANNIGARLETGYRAGTSAAAVTPYAAAQVQNFRTPSYAETVVSGSPQFALAYRNNSVTATRLEAGYWLDTLVAFTGNHTIALRGRAAWAYDAGNQRQAGATFQALPGASFTVLGAKPASHLALLTGGAELRLGNGISLGAKVEGEFSARSNTYSGTGSARYAW
jgi:outer membrane autotransporter protein